MLPENFSEKCIRVYCKHADARDKATECFRRACEELDLIPPKVNILPVCNVMHADFSFIVEHCYEFENFGKL